MTIVAGAPPLSVAQEALWYIGVLDPRRLSYNETVSIRKDGPLDVDALRQAFAAMLRRHAPWRTTFDDQDGRPVQVVHPAPEVDLPVVDLSGLAPVDAEDRATQAVAELARVPYDLRRGPLVRPRLVRLPGEHHRLYLAMHHIVFDGVSLYRVVLPELVALYDAFAAGAPSPLADLEADYADYARWEQEWVDGPRGRRRLAYWQQRLAGAPDLALPLDHPRPAEPRYRGGVLSLTVPRPVVEALRTTGLAVGGSLFQALAAAWALLLSRWSDADDVVFAVAADLRQRPEYEGVVGCALTPLVVRVDADAPAFSDLVVRVRNELLDGLDHVMPFERVVRALPAGGASGAANPVYQTMLVLEPALVAPDPAWSLHQMEGEIGNTVGATKLDLELELDERPEGHLAGRLIYDRDLFEPGTAARLADHFLRAVTAVAADPSLPAARVPLADTLAEERRIAAFNATTVELTQRAIPGHVRERARALGHPVPHGSDAAVLNLAAGLADLGVGLGPQDTVLVLPATAAQAPALALWVPLLAGARIVCADAAQAASGAQLSRLISREKVTFLHAAPSTWRDLIDTGLRAGRSLRALSGGEPLDDALAAAILARCRVLWSACGPGMPALAGRIDPDEPVTIGRPLANCGARIVDRHGRPAMIGVYGELRLTGVDGREVATGDRARWRPGGTVELA